MGEWNVPRLRAVADVAAAMLDSVGNEDRVLSLVAAAVAEHLDASCSAWLSASGTAEPTVAFSGHPAQQRKLLEHAVTARLARYDVDAAEVPRLDLGADVALVAPLRVRGRTLGALAVTRAEPFDEADTEFIEALASVAGTTLDHARMFADSSTILEDLRRQGELLDHISDAIIACDSDGLILSWNAGAERLYGYQAGEVVGGDLFALLATRFFIRDGIELSRENITEELRRGGRWTGELRERRADGVPLTVQSAISEGAIIDGERPGVVVVNRDVSEQRREEHRALHDALTDLPNRRMLVNRLYDALARKHRGAGPLAVLFLDLNKFKPVNDTYGHAVGDELLRVIAARLSHAVRNSDLVARLGGDEFVALLENAGSAENVRQAVERIRAAVAEPAHLAGATVSVTTSVGVAFLDDLDGEAGDPEMLIDAADSAMYEAKRRGLDVLLVPAPTKVDTERAAAVP